MNNKRIIIGVTIGIIAAILWSVVFINVLNSMAGIGIGINLCKTPPTVKELAV